MHEASRSGGIQELARAIQLKALFSPCAAAPAAAALYVVAFASWRRACRRWREIMQILASIVGARAALEGRMAGAWNWRVMKKCVLVRMRSSCIA